MREPAPHEEQLKEAAVTLQQQLKQTAPAPALRQQQRPSFVGDRQLTGLVAALATEDSKVGWLALASSDQPVGSRAMLFRARRSVWHWASCMWAVLRGTAGRSSPLSVLFGNARMTELIFRHVSAGRFECFLRSRSSWFCFSSLPTSEILRCLSRTVFVCALCGSVHIRFSTRSVVQHFCLRCRLLLCL